MTDETGGTFQITTVDPIAFAMERKRCQELLMRLAPEFRVVEVGSSAAPGTIGQNNVDFLIYSPESKFGGLIARLSKRLKEVPHNMQNTYYRTFQIPANVDATVRCTSNKQLRDRFLTFLHLIQNDQSVREQYKKLKLAHNGLPMQKYQRSKADFIRRALETD